MHIFMETEALGALYFSLGAPLKEDQNREHVARQRYSGPGYLSEKDEPPSKLALRSC